LRFFREIITTEDALPGDMHDIKHEGRGIAAVDDLVETAFTCKQGMNKNRIGTTTSEAIQLILCDLCCTYSTVEKSNVGSH
jgi:hypothetical protein